MVEDTTKAILCTGVVVALVCAFCTYAPTHRPNTLGALLVGIGVLGVLAIMAIKR